MPDHPCCTVEVKSVGVKYEAEIFDVNGRLTTHYGPASQEAILQWCHEDAERNKHSLHFHWN